ncbi:MAG: hypothetical protein K6D54_02255 [Bacteroidales bacterium]|nr:hypothetical protein [Bacteroidales bacterium]
MKKYFIIAAAALVAFAACTKVEVADTPETAQKISFEVAKYMATTKAETSLLAETDATGTIVDTFATNAWYHSVNDGTQYFMKDVDILWKSSVNEWSSVIDYYWPKTGYVNFFSYAGTPGPTTVNAENSLVYTDKVIAYNDNVLVADAAYGFHANLAEYKIDHSSVQGVTTLFRHYLSKIAFNVMLRTTEAKKSATNYFKVEVLEASIKVSNKGTLTLSNADPNTSRTASAPGTPAINPWTNSNATNPNVAWVPATWNESSSVEEIKIVASPVAGKDMVAKTLNLAKNAVRQTESDTVMLAMRSVMPQALTNNHVFYIKYKVSAYNDDSTDPYSVETLEFSKPITNFISGTTITAWNKNTKYTYNVIIDPIASKITFDPAVEEWANEEQNFDPWLN